MAEILPRLMVLWRRLLRTTGQWLIEQAGGEE